MAAIYLHLTHAGGAVEAPIGLSVTDHQGSEYPFVSLRVTQGVDDLMILVTKPQLRQISDAILAGIEKLEPPVEDTVLTDENLTTNLARFTALEKRRRDLEAEIKAVEAEAGKLADRLLDQFSQAGIQNARVNGLTVYIHRQLWASAADGDYGRACEVLRRSGHGMFVAPRFNVNQLSAFVREQDKAGRALPPEWEGAIKVAEVFRLRTQKAR